MVNRRVLAAGMVVLAMASVPSIGQAETLKQALTSAYANNPVISSALFGAKAAAESIPQAASATRPNVSLGAGLNGSFASQGGGPFQSDASANLGLNYQQTLFDNGQTDARVKAAKASTEQAVQGLRSAEQAVLLSAVTAYMDVIRDTQLVALRGDNVNFYQTQVKSAQDRLSLGEGTKIDVSQAQASLASGQALYEAAKASLETSKANYVHWIGHEPRDLTSAYRLNGLVPATLNEALASADARHPSILAAQAAISAAQYNSRAAENAYGPSIDASGSFGPTFDLSSGGTGTPADNPTLSGRVGLSLSVPIYSGGRLSSSARQANLQAIKTDLDAQAARATVHEQVVTAWATLQNANAQIRSAQAAVNAGQLALEGVIQERDVGQATTLDVLNAQTTVTTAKEQLISANATKVIATFTLIGAEGRLSAQDLALNVEVKSPEGYITKAEDVWKELRTLD